jgi:hypothetical protein
MLLLLLLVLPQLPADVVASCSSSCSHACSCCCRCKACVDVLHGQPSVINIFLLRAAAAVATTAIITVMVQYHCQLLELPACPVHLLPPQQLLRAHCQRLLQVLPMLMLLL